MEKFGSDDGSRFLSELASHTANLSASSEVESEYLRVRAKLLEQQKCLEGWFQHMLVTRPGDELQQNFNHDMSMMHPPQVLRPLSTKYSKYSAASSGTQTPSTCSASSDLSRSSDSSQGPPGLLQERQMLLEQMQEMLFARNELPQQPWMNGWMTSTPNLHAANFQDQHAVSGMQMPSWIDPAPASSANLGAWAQNMQPQKVPIHAHSKFPYMSQDSSPPFQFNRPIMGPASLLPRQDPLGEPPAIAPGSLEHMQMLSKIAELQQQLNEQQKLLEAATQGSGCPTIQAIPEQVQHGKGKGAAAGYPRGIMPSMPPGLKHQKNKGSHMAKDHLKLQQQLNEQQKLLEAATLGSGCPTIQAIPEQVQHGKGKGAAAGYPRGIMPSMPHGLEHQKNKGSRMAKDQVQHGKGKGTAAGYPKGIMPSMPPGLEHQKNKGSHMAKDHLNDKNGKAANPQLANNATLQMHLKELGDEDPSCIFIVRKVNRLGFRSVETLNKFFSQHDTVVKVLVAHSKVMRNPKGLPEGGSSELYLRPGSLGFVLMKTPESVQKILAQGPTITVQGISIRVQPFSRGVSGASEMKGDDAGDEADIDEDQD